MQKTDSRSKKKFNRALCLDELKGILASQEPIKMKMYSTYEG